MRQLNFLIVLSTMIAACKAAPKKSNLEAANASDNVKKYYCQILNDHSGKADPSVYAKVSYPTPTTMEIQTNAGKEFGKAGYKTSWRADENEVLTLNLQKEGFISRFMSTIAGTNSPPTYTKEDSHYSGTNKWITTWTIMGTPKKSAYLRDDAGNAVKYGDGFLFDMQTSDWLDGSTDDPGLTGSKVSTFKCM